MGKFDNKVIHGTAVVFLLNRYARNETRTACGSFAPQERS